MFGTLAAIVGVSAVSFLVGVAWDRLRTLNAARADGLQTWFDAEAARSRRHGLGVAVTVLQGEAETLSKLAQTEARRYDRVAVTDEGVLFCTPDVEPTDAERVVARISQVAQAAGPAVSIGQAYFPAEAATLDELVRVATGRLTVSSRFDVVEGSRP